MRVLIGACLGAFALAGVLSPALAAKPTRAGCPAGHYPVKPLAQQNGGAGVCVRLSVAAQNEFCLGKSKDFTQLHQGKANDDCVAQLVGLARECKSLETKKAGTYCVKVPSSAVRVKSEPPAKPKPSKPVFRPQRVGDKDVEACGVITC